MPDGDGLNRGPYSKMSDFQAMLEELPGTRKGMMQRRILSTDKF
jgi:hypothetical protein